MPHLTIEISERIAASVSLPALCDHLHGAMVGCGIFPLEGIRVRAYVPQACAIADRDPANGFVALLLNVGHGRARAELATAGERLFDAARAFLADRRGGHFALSLEIREIDPDLTWKENGIRTRLAAADTQGVRA